MDLPNILQFMHEVEKLKTVLRHSWLSSGRQESTAEHTWRLSLLAMLLAPKLETKVDLLKTLKMCLIHDLNEAYIGDVPAFASNLPEHRTRELANIKNLQTRFPGPIMAEINDLWLEYEAGVTTEAKYVHAVNNIETRLQHNEASIATWNEIEFPRSLFAADQASKFDAAVKQFNELIKAESRQKIMSQSDLNIEIVEKLAQDLAEQ